MTLMLQGMNVVRNTVVGHKQATAWHIVYLYPNTQPRHSLEATTLTQTVVVLILE